MMARKTFGPLLLAVLASVSVAAAQDAAPTPSKCAAVPVRKFPPAPAAAAVKQGRFAACVPAKQCDAADEKLKLALARNFCAMNHYEACRAGTCDKGGMSCQPELRQAETKGVKLSMCVSRPAKMSCPKDGDEICLCDVEVEPKGALSCGCACQPAPTPTAVK